MDSSQDEIGASAILGAQLDDELGGGPVQVKTHRSFRGFFVFSPAYINLFIHVFKISALLWLAQSSNVPPDRYILSLFLLSLMLLLSSLVFLFCVFRLLVLP